MNICANISRLLRAHSYFTCHVSFESLVSGKRRARQIVKGVVRGRKLQDFSKRHKIGHSLRSQTRQVPQVACLLLIQPSYQAGHKSLLALAFVFETGVFESRQPSTNKTLTTVSDCVQCRRAR